jgi:hypothetical protein
MNCAPSNVWAALAQDNEKKTKLKFYPQPDGTALAVFGAPAASQLTHMFWELMWVSGEWGEMKGKPVRMDNWLFNGDLEFPTFSPSLKYDDCHLILRRGILEFCGDCKHELKNKDVEMELF